MELANGKVNKFFTPKDEGENRYFVEKFDAEKTKGLNNVFMLTRNIPENSIVLDIGCAQGKFGEELKKKNCTAYGIDSDAKAAECAKKTGCYKEVLVMDMTRDDTPEYQRLSKLAAGADAIIFSDVFEHLTDPTAILCRYARFLKEGGIILVSVPNVAHMDIALHLLDGKFNYTDMGILDNTHLKFFTKNSFVEWIDEINHTFSDIKFGCNFLGATFYNNDYLAEIKEKYSELYAILEHAENFNGLQLLFKLTKLPADAEAPAQQEEETPKVVDMLGQALKGKLKDMKAPELVNGERLWYQTKFDAMKQDTAYVKSLENSVEWFKKHDEEIRKANVLQDSYAQKLEKSIEWYRNHDEEMRKAIASLNNASKNREAHFKDEVNTLNAKISGLQKTILYMQKTIFDMQNSFSWKITKFLRKKDGKENKV